MGKKSIFSASFEESLNLEDDGFIRYQKVEIYEKLAKYYKKGKASAILFIQSIVLTLLFPLFANFMLLVFSLHIHETEMTSLTVPVWEYPLLTVPVYLVCSLIWFTLVLLGKFISQVYLWPYRYHFHVITFLIWILLEFNLLALDLMLPNLSNIGVMIVILGLIVFGFIILKIKVSKLHSLLYDSSTYLKDGQRNSDRLIKRLIVIITICSLVSILLRALSLEFSLYLKVIGIFFTWLVSNIAVILILVIMEFPSFLQAYYKWKYPEEYRAWEGKTKLEWYGENYLKKHKELLDDENN